jgi:MazG family protein
MSSTGEKFQRVVAIMARLRAPGGCPWDREQSFDSIKPYTLEETYEVLEAIDNRDFQELPGELGDLLLQVLFYSQMAQEENRFSIDDVLDRLSSKLIDRHPHVFGDAEAKTSHDVVRNWEALKAEEKKKRRAAGESSPVSGALKDDSKSILEDVSPGIPALLEAMKLSARAAHIGFDWPDVQGIFQKLEEETGELKKHLRNFPATGPRPVGRGTSGSGASTVPAELHALLEEEVGDLLFVLVNLARYLSLDPESSLKRTNRKFRRRFQYIERELRARGRAPAAATLEEMESLWQQSKQQERVPK